MQSSALSTGSIIREPVASEPGYWAGAPGAYYQEEERAWYLTYRIRRPRGVAPDRGGEARIARSKDLKTWEDIWSVRKDQFGSASIERCALRKGLDRYWRYYASYVDPIDNRWCVSQMIAREIGSLDPKEAKPLFKAEPLRLEGIKDPWIYADAGRFYMLLSVAVPTPKTTAESHSTADIFNTGECVSATGLAVSNDLDNWEWKGIVFKPDSSGWDRYCRRLNSVVPLGEKLLGFYDGSAGHHENYEEKCGLALSTNWLDWNPLTLQQPAFTSPNSSKSLRYLDAQIVAEEPYLFFEFARPDGSHDLRFIKANLKSLAGVI